MIYLSIIMLNSILPQRRRMLADCYELHRSIMSAFPDEGGGVRQKYNVLYSLKACENRMELLVQSDIKPDWEISGLNLHYPGESYSCKEISGIMETAVTNGKIFSFHLTASPAKKILSGGKNSKRVLLSKKDEQIAWLVRKGEQYGFAVSSSSIVVRANDANSGRKKGIFFRSVEFSGKLSILERERFLDALVKGIGSEKAFGCGLLMISKERNVL